MHAALVQPALRPASPLLDVLPLATPAAGQLTLGELTCCRIWHDHKKDGWHLHEVVVQLKDGGEAPWCALGPSWAPLGHFSVI
jgi:hypothetical protein